MHIIGLAGMPRRVYTYPDGLGWELLNLISTLGAFMIAAGVLLFIFDLARNLRRRSGSRSATCGRAPRSNGCTTTFTDRAACRSSRAAIR